MSYPIKYPTPQGANIQIFNGGDPQTTGHLFEKTWVKPQGASFVWFTLIGAGGGIDNSASTQLGGGSGAVTNFMCPAFLIPDSLSIVVGKGGTDGIEGTQSIVYYQQKTGTGYTLLTANGGKEGTTTGAGAGGTAMTANFFTAMGFFQSVAGQDGVNAAQSASATTFLSGGSYTSTVTGNYGYLNTGNGSFRMQPIIVGTGGGSLTNGRGGIGCGGGGSSTAIGSGVGGDGMVVIITW
jgi:hypothetical protein